MESVLKRITCDILAIQLKYSASKPDFFNRSHSADTPLTKVSHIHLPGLLTSPLNNSQLIILRECTLTCRNRPRSLERRLSRYFCLIISPCLSLSLLQRIHLTVQIFTYLNLYTLCHQFLAARKSSSKTVRFTCTF